MLGTPSEPGLAGLLCSQTKPPPNASSQNPPGKAASCPGQGPWALLIPSPSQSWSSGTPPSIGSHSSRTHRFGMCRAHHTVSLSLSKCL